MLTDKAWALLRSEAPRPEEGRPQLDGEVVAKPELIEPEDLFQDIIGHDDVKELLRACLAATRLVHVLLAGPPVLAKSLFLWELERVLGERAC